MKAKQLFPDIYGKSIPWELENAYTEAVIVLQGRAWAHYSVLMNVPMVWTHGTNTMGTDGAYIYANPVFFLALANAEERAFLLFHEVSHIIYKHPMRTEFFGERGFHSIRNGIEVPFDHETYNKCEDVVINADGVAHGLTPPQAEAFAGLFDDRFGRDDLVDHVYVTIWEEAMQNPQQDQGTEGDPADNNSSASSGSGQGGDGADAGQQASDASDGDGTGDSGSNSGATTGSSGDQQGDGTEGGDGQQASDSSGGNTDSGKNPISPDGSGAGNQQATSGETPSQGDGGGQGQGTEGESADNQSSEDGNAPQRTPHRGHDDHFRPQYEGTPEEQAEAREEDMAQMERIVDDALDSLESGLKDGSIKGIGASSPMRAQGYRWSGEGTASHTNWHGEFNDLFTRRGTSGDANWGRINRKRFGCFGVVAPTYIATVNQIAFIVDISGSVDRLALHKAMLELANVMDMLMPPDGCLVIFTNTDVHSYHEVTTSSELLDLDVPLGGGTRMHSAIEWMQQMGFTPDITVCFTDGEMYTSDWQAMVDDDVAMVLDREPDAWVAQRIAEVKGTPRIIVVNDDMFRV